MVKYLLLFLIVCNFCFSQNTDSLFSALEIQKKVGDKPQQLKLYKKLGHSFYKDLDFSQSLNCFYKALDIAEDDFDKAWLHKQIGQVLVDSTNNEKAIEHLGIALELFTKLNNREEMALTSTLLGMGYGLSNKLDKSIDAFKMALEVYIENSDSSNIGYGYYNIGLAYYFKGQLDFAIDNFVQSAKIRQNLPDTTTLVASFTSIGEVFRTKEAYNKAEAYYSRALKLKKGIHSKQVLAYIYSELALLHKLRGNYPASLLFIDTAMVLCKQAKYRRGVATLFSYRAGINRKLGATDRADSLYKHTIELYREIGFEPGVVQSHIALSEIAKEKKQYPQALAYLKPVEAMAQNNGILEEQRDISELKYEIFKSLGEKEKALIEVEKFMLLKDSLFDVEKEKSISDVETKYQVAQKEKRIELLDKENQVKTEKLNALKYQIIALSVFILLVAAVGFLLFRQNKLRAELQLEQNRQKLLRSQMNPHFMYNALSAIQNFILQNEPMESVMYISNFSELMRKVLEGSRSDFVCLEDDIILVNSYLKLQCLRFNNSFQFNVNVDKNLTPEILQIPPMLSQPFIENAIEHGMRKLPENTGLIEVNYKALDGNFTVEIIDNGPGIKEQTKNEGKKHKSLATTITRERIDNITKSHGLKIEMTIKALAEKGTCVSFKIPLAKSTC